MTDSSTGSHRTPLRIAFVVGQFPKLSETFIVTQITGLLDRGHDVRIFSRRHTDERRHRQVDDHDLLSRTTFFGDPSGSGRVRLMDLPRTLLSHPRPGALLRTTWRRASLRRGLRTDLVRAARILELEDQSFDIVHCHFAHNAVSILPLRRLGLLLGPLVTSFHGYDVNVVPREQGTSVYRHLFAVGDLFTANSGFTARNVVALGCPTDRLVIQPMGIHLDEIPYAERRLPARGPIRILTIGRLTEKKGIIYALRALRKVVDRAPDVAYQIVGDGPLRPELMDAAGKLGLDKHVIFSGWMTRSELASALAASHLFLLPSVAAANGDVEGQGVVLQEAQAAGLPVVASRHNGFPESVPLESVPHLVAERDVDGLSARLLDLIANPERWKDMGERGRRFVEERFDSKKLIGKLEAIYRDLMARGSGDHPPDRTRSSPRP
ncbi:MAG: glycosyltransferase [Acidobacteriota bacterium]